MEGKTVIVTGANNGIGKEAAKKLALMGARVILACRNLETGKKAKEEIIEATGNGNLVLKKIDLSSFQSIREFAEDVNNTELQLHVLIHNAGVCLSNNQNNDDGLELTMMTNHFGPFLLTHLLIDLLKKAAPSRIVVVSSISHHLGHLHFSNTTYEGAFLPQMNYFNSKLANVIFTRELSRRLQGSGVTANCLHPGLIYTEIWNALPAPLTWILGCIKRLLMKSAEEGSQTTVYLATSEEVQDISGKYFADCKKAYISKRALSLEEAKRLWEISEEIVQLGESDPRI